MKKIKNIKNKSGKVNMTIGAKSGDIDHLNPVESDHLLSGAN
ncbi:MAG: hypothetical protein ABSD71_13970 [Bacteroidales bacterium]|jgi:hypothetical protein